MPWPRPVAAGLLAGLALDAAVGDPRRWHPVAGFGRAAAAAESWWWRDSRAAGAAHTVLCVGIAAGLGLTADRALVRRPLARSALTALATWAVVGGTTLGREAGRLGAALRAGDLVAARARVPSLCARDPAALDRDGLARAAVESVAENTSDAVVAPLLWGALLGPAGLLGYRAANTLDAMVGYRSPRYRRFGWAAARLDDVANWVPARVTAVVAVVLAPAVGGERRTAWEVVRRDGGRHPSPNAGRCEAAFAGALGLSLGGPNVYDGVVDDRPALGDGRPPTVADIDRTLRLSRAVGLVAGALAAALACLRWR